MTNEELDALDLYALDREISELVEPMPAELPRYHGQHSLKSAWRGRHIAADVFEWRPLHWSRDRASSFELIEMCKLDLTWKDDGCPDVIGSEPDFEDTICRYMDEPDLLTAAARAALDVLRWRKEQEQKEQMQQREQKEGENAGL